MMVTRCGMSPELGNVDLDSNYEQLSTSTKQVIETEVRNLIEAGRARAEKLLRDRRKELDLLAQALLKYETLNQDEAFRVVKGETLDDRPTVTPVGKFKLPEQRPGATPPAGSSQLPEIPGSKAADGGKPPPPVGGLTA